MPKICALDKNTNRCVGVYDIDDISLWTDHGDFILSPRHDGQSGWILQNGEWIDPYIVVKTEAEKWAEIRAKRDNLLMQTDKYLFFDFPIDADDKNTVLQYRETLRNIPQTYQNADDVVWPEFPMPK